VYEAGIKGIPLYFYNYDMNNYEVVRGLAIDYDDLPGYKEQNATKLVEAFEKPYDYDYLNSYITKNVGNIKDCTKKMAQDVLNMCR
jgi:hypothetical protein